jgi:hypothetical protein
VQGSQKIRLETHYFKSFKIIFTYRPRVWILKLWVASKIIYNIAYFILAISENIAVACEKRNLEIFVISQLTVNVEML